jgi:hypothetical protein
MSYEFDDQIQEAVYMKVLMWSYELYGDDLLIAEDVPGIRYLHGSADVDVRIGSLGEFGLVVVYSIVVRQPRPSLELYRFLLEANSGMIMGAFSIDPGGDVVFSHHLLGMPMDKPELQMAIRGVGLMADKYDDEIVSRFGGLRARDRPS